MGAPDGPTDSFGHIGVYAFEQKLFLRVGVDATADELRLCGIEQFHYSGEHVGWQIVVGRAWRAAFGDAVVIGNFRLCGPGLLIMHYGFGRLLFLVGIEVYAE